MGMLRTRVHVCIVSEVDMHTWQGTYELSDSKHREKREKVDTPTHDRMWKWKRRCELAYAAAVCGILKRELSAPSGVVCKTRGVLG